MRTAIVSDLHLSSAFGEDVARDAGIRRRLFEEIGSADRLVMLGDAIELREGPLARALAAAEPFFVELGEAMAGRPVILVPGNHDNRLAEPLLEEVALAGRALGLEHRAAPSAEAATMIAEWLGPAAFEIAYPGIWLREDVYATHGHYMDLHMSLPRLECIAAAAVMRGFGPLPPAPKPADYERMLRPIYGLSFSLAQSGLARRAARPSERAWKAFSGGNGTSGLRKKLVRGALGAGIPATIWSLNRLLRADFEATLTHGAISRSGIEAATEMSERLELGAAHVITGHTHRGGPWDGEAEWELPGGGRLHNTGSWVFASAFHRPGTPPGPYWPGTVTWLEDEAPPRHVRLLTDRPGEELRKIVERSAMTTGGTTG